MRECIHACFSEGTTEYTTCDNLLNTAGGDWPGSALFEIAAAGVDLNKLVIGKPGNSAGDADSGFIAPATLAGCVAQAKAKGWGEPLLSPRVSELSLTGLLLLQMRGSCPGRCVQLLSLYPWDLRGI